MNSQDIFNGVTDIRDDLIDGAKGASKKQKQRGKHLWLRAVAAVLAVTVTAGFFLRSGGGLTAYAITEAAYPKMARYPGEPLTEAAYNAWWESITAQRRDLGDIAPLRAFFARSSRTFLSGEEGQNRVYSPLNVYMALSMLAQLTDGESREQILSLLGSDSIDALRQQASDVWNSNYRNDGALTSILASSLWLDQGVNYNQDTLNILAQELYASSYRGEMGSEQFDKALQSWLNEQTGGLLQEQAGNVELDKDTFLALATTVYFKAKWSYEFSKGKTTTETFHAPDGDLEVSFMHQRDDQNYYWGNRFAAVAQYFEGSSSSAAMWFLLPDEGITPEKLLSDGEAMDFLFTANKNEWENRKHLFVNKSIPKFDVSSQLELTKGLRELGVTDVFDPDASDFTPMTSDVEAPIVLSRASHAARVVIDEEGCTAAAFTVIANAGATAPPDDEVDFILDRPFLFCITGINGLPLFVGVVNVPFGG